MKQAIKNFDEFFKEVSQKFVGRETEINHIKYALLIKEHVLLQGGPGTAKSMLARTIFQNIHNSEGKPVNLFQMQLSKFMNEDYLFGPINIKKLRE
jgi:MoxR-like ATPase